MSLEDEKRVAEAFASPNIQRVVVTDIDISMNSMIWLMIKFSIATIPAAIVIAMLYGLGYVIFGAVFLKMFQ